MSYKLLISTFIVIILAGFASGLYIGLTYKDGGTDAVAEPAETGSLAGSFIVPNDIYYCVFCEYAIFNGQEHTCPRSKK